MHGPAAAHGPDPLQLEAQVQDQVQVLWMLVLVLRCQVGGRTARARVRQLQLNLHPALLKAWSRSCLRAHEAGNCQCGTRFRAQLHRWTIVALRGMGMEALAWRTAGVVLAQHRHPDWPTWLHRAPAAPALDLLPRKLRLLPGLLAAALGAASPIATAQRSPQAPTLRRTESPSLASPRATVTRWRAGRGSNSIQFDLRAFCAASERVIDSRVVASNVQCIFNKSNHPGITEPIHG